MGKHSAKGPLIDRATIRTLFQAIVSFCVLAPLIVAAIGIDSSTGFAATFIACTAAVTRVMQVPAVNEWLEKYIFTRWLAK